MRYGIYGGAFDPIHLGHLLLAESCLCGARLDRVIFVPTGISPHRGAKDSYTASGNDRYNMIALAIDGYNEFEVSRFEIDRGKISYTVDTLRYFIDLYKLQSAQNSPTQKTSDEFFLIMGCDMFCDLPNWYESDKILQLATPLVAAREGSTLPNSNINHTIINMPQINISSTKIRNMIAKNINPRFQVPEKTLDYITKNNLYKNKTGKL
ncbi:MAG: nicotinate-nucleotide adenylyltransferase [Planctomycetaceae bacterium]|jgi:nicotinate-nucleotide adenylyltransferase|nr:nicotinate-nucleotide adenylyltransferase [Planctomycetaceae bacterium]